MGSTGLGGVKRGVWCFWGLTPHSQETTYRNYQRIRLRPEQFPAYLTSPEVGFERCELLGTPQHSSKGGGAPRLGCTPNPRGGTPTPGGF